MGQGDKPKPFSPSYKPIRDDVIGKTFAPISIRQCPHPEVIKKYGVGGVANVSVWTCRMCRHRIEDKYYGGVSCGYMA